ncbi:MAG: UDP-N-acetylmuramoyl-tripeptide--D-alanyl-D-alanine ligase [Candidatus Hydrogenedens sp.]|jgi:UDP-N-acetylmuramoyl-tripeptide--D-alanyl-D-alanine ligase|nr:UDP-N-acetylmuramoyl-tripeptide--D-alanyl-D-alanine ligase [Candidatus Hydrogenedens sp.]
MSLCYTLDEAAVLLGLHLNMEAPEDSVIKGVSTDTRTLRPGDLFFALNGENFRGDDFVEEAFRKGAVAAVTEGLNHSGPVFQTSSPLTALQQMAKEHRKQCPARIIGITGSCGKTTAKDMLATLLSSEYLVEKTQGNLNNDIGCPLSLFRLSRATHFGIIELGANHPGEIRMLAQLARPEEGVVTLIAPAHLEGFGTVEGVARAKSELMESLPHSGCFYVNMDDPWCRRMGEDFRGESIRFGTGGDVYLKNIDFDDDGEMVLKIHPIGTLRLPLRIRAHVSHVLLAVAVGLRHGILSFEEPLREACLLGARFQESIFQGIQILDDSYNANPTSMKAALEGLRDYPGKRKIAIVGDMYELGDTAKLLHEKIGSYAASLSLDALLALGEYGPALVARAQAEGLTEARACDSHGEAAQWLLDHAREGDVLLFKGSRGMKMESVFEQWKALVSSQQ